MSGEIVVGLDIGSTKVCALVGETSPGGAVQITGAGAAPCSGLRRGVVVDLSSTVRSIRECVQKASRQAQVEAHRVTVGISGEHIHSETVTARVLVADPVNGIMPVDLSRVMEQAKARFGLSDRFILHAEPRFYAVDGQSGIRKPVGMIGKNLEAEIHVVTADRACADNLLKAVERADLSVEEEGLIFNAFASAESTLTADERQVGVAIADIGGGVTDLAVYHRGEICASAVIPVGGGHVTQDLSLGLQVSEEEAERLKLQYGSTTGEEEIIDIRRPGSEDPMPIPRKLLTQIIEPRMEELFELILASVKTSGVEKPGAGIVLTGGGALLPGALTIAERSFGGLEARLGQPRCAGGIADGVAKPAFASSVGLIMIASKRSATDAQEMDDDGLLRPVKKGLGRWLRGLFGGR